MKKNFFTITFISLFLLFSGCVSLQENEKLIAEYSISSGALPPEHYYEKTLTVNKSGLAILKEHYPYSEEKITISKEKKLSQEELADFITILENADIWSMSEEYTLKGFTGGQPATMKFTSEEKTKTITVYPAIIEMIDQMEGQNKDGLKKVLNTFSELMNTIEEENTVLCAMDVHICPDGTAVARNPANNCEFFECPGEGVFCTADAKICPDGSAVARNPANNCEFFDCPGEVACTKDARICPDGTGVGRVAPDCEFEECPALVFCDAQNSCPAGFECYSFPDSTAPFCFSENQDPCFFACETRKCIIQESHPATIVCLTN
jgi:hypothetical protein